MDSFQREALWRWWLTPSELELYELDAHGEPGSYLSSRAWHKVLERQLNDHRWKPLISNKLIYGSYFDDWDVRTARTLGFLSPGRGFARDDPTRALNSITDLTWWLRESDHRAFVLKPVSGWIATGVVIVDDVQWRADSATFFTTDRRELTERELAGELVMGFRGISGYVIQERIPQHSWFRELSGAPSHSLRVVTWTPKDDPPTVQMAVAVLGRKGLMVGNWDQGGVSAGIDLETGTLRRGRFKLKHGGWADTHPDTGTTIAGQTLPHWEATCELVRHAASVTPGLRSVLWEVVVNEDGPVLIEANTGWSVEHMQVHTGGFIGSEIGGAWARAGVDLPDGSGRWLRRHWWKAVRPPRGQAAPAFAREAMAAGGKGLAARLRSWGRTASC